MQINLPSIADQQAFIFKAATQEGITTLQNNLNAPTLPGQTAVDENAYPRSHLLREAEGWEAPHPEIIKAYFKNFQEHFPEYGSDKKLASLLILSSDRRVREYKEGARTIPYGVWRRFLVLTGKAPQEIIPVLAFIR
ncbi:MAG: hypothetical protein K2Q15_09945 [Burkholderiales bacterium]|nr:hypothetical protein [Burkholderiales bacterium]